MPPDGAAAADLVVLAAQPGDAVERVIRELREQVASRAVVVLGAGATIRGVMSAFAAGACGYIALAITAPTLLAVLRLAAHGYACCPAITALLMQRTAKPAQLAPREAAILARVALGERNDEIAANLEISAKTVEYHIRKLSARTHARTRVDLATWWAWYRATVEGEKEQAVAA